MRIGSSAGAARRAPQIASAALFALMCGTGTYWALQLFAPRTAIAPVGSLADAARLPDIKTASLLFGAANGQPDAPLATLASDIAVLGVAASRERASAVVAIDGAAPRAFAVGDSLDTRTRLVEIRPDAIVIDRGAGPLRLAAPARPDPGLLSAGPAVASSAAAPAAPVRVAPVNPVPAQNSALRRPAGVRQ